MIKACEIAHRLGKLENPIYTIARIRDILEKYNLP